MPAYKPLVDRFWEKVDKNGPIPEYRPELGPCWIWTAYKSNEGYGQISGERRKPRHIYVHRFSYELLNGPILEGLTLDHLCRVRCCVNPGHLEPVTNRENILRGTAPSANQSRQTHCVNGHLFDDKNTYLIKGHRICKLCSIIRVYARRGEDYSARMVRS
jgi:hypothetical protein